VSEQSDYIGQLEKAAGWAVIFAVFAVGFIVGLAVGVYWL
jgi:hypothetical protein